MSAISDWAGQPSDAAGIARTPTLVFVVDDEPGIRNALKGTLERAGYEVEAFIDAECVIAALDRRHPFLVVLDVALQRSDAIQVMQALSDRSFAGAIQLLSGNSPALLTDIRLIGERRQLRMLPALTKPCRMRAIRDAVDAEALARSGLAAPSRRADGGSPAGAARPAVSLSDALDDGRVEVWYQPKFDLATGLLAGAECLARVRRADGELALPGSFLPGATLVEMERLTGVVLQRALLDWPDFSSAGIRLKPSVNVSCEILSTFPLAAMLRQHVDKAEGWPGLILEITEEDALRDVERAHEAAIQLMIYGVDLSIDDFGLGYSGLSRLRDIPFKEVKLDRSLVHGSANDRMKGALCKAVVDLAHSLQAVVVGEGVELETDHAYMRAIGCDLGQGYLFARPMPKDALLEEVRAGRFRGFQAGRRKTGDKTGDKAGDKAGDREGDRSGERRGTGLDHAAA